VKGLLSTRDAAKKLGVTILTLQRHVSAKTVDAPPLQKVGGVNVRLWTARDIEKARKVLAGMRPGRKRKT
jgi:transposase